MEVSDLLDGNGWVFWNPDTGEEYSQNHPIESGECDDAEHIRKSTRQEDALWAGMQEQFKRANALASPSAEAAKPVGDGWDQYRDEAGNPRFDGYDKPALSQPQGELREGMVLVPRATAAKLIDALHWWDIRSDVKNQYRVIDAARSIAALAGSKHRG